MGVALLTSQGSSDVRGRCGFNDVTKQLCGCGVMGWVWRQ